MKRLFYQALGGLLLALLFIAPAPAAISVIASRVWPAEDYTRITLESNKPIPYKIVLLRNPERLVLDMEDVELSATLKLLSDKIQAGDPYVRQVRVANFKPGVLRMVVDLKTEVTPNIFLLPPAGEYKNRLVLDIYPLQDPLMTMLQQRDKPAVTSSNITDNNTAAGPADSITIHDLRMAPSIATDTVTQDVVDIPKVVPNAIPQVTPEVPVLPIPPVAGETSRAVKPEVLPSNKKDAPRMITVAIDPGHGGEDPGARGANGTHEKDVTLAIGKKLKELIDAEPNMRGILTRDADFFIPLHGRVVKARNMQADLFVSIHADAFIRPDARGSSVFALSEGGATSASARYLAKKENESDLIGGVSLDDKDPYLARTLLDLSQTATISDSLKLGKAVLGRLGSINGLHRGIVEQAGFAVLKSPDIPSILVETAFISNPEEEQKLNDDDYQQKLAGAILAGIKRYFASNPAMAKSKIVRE